MNKEEKKQFDKKFKDKLWKDPDGSYVSQEKSVKRYISKYYISKAEVKEKIEKLKQDARISDNGFGFSDITIHALEELLKQLGL